MDFYIRQIVDAIREGEERALHLRLGVVQTVDHTNKTATLTIGGSTTVVTAKYLIQPPVPYVVLVLQEGTDVTILGTLGAASYEVPAARVHRTTAQACGSGGYTILSWDALDWSFDVSPAIWVVGSPTRLTAPRTGLYAITGGLSLNNFSVVNTRLILDLVANGGTNFKRTESWVTNSTTGGAFVTLDIGTEWYLNSGDYIELWFYQNAGGTINTVGGQFCNLTMSLIRETPV